MRGPSEQTRRIVETALHLWRTVYQPNSIVPTVRSLFYRLAVMEVVEKSERGYDRVQYALARARERGDYPWEAIYDGLRELSRPQTWATLDDFLDVVRNAYSRDKWQTQPRRVEVWLEKQTLQGTLQSVIDEFEVPLLVDRGYLSVTAKKDATLRLRAQPRTIIYVGDHDPSGVNMLVEAEEWIRDMAGQGIELTIDRIAITDDDQADESLPHLPVNPRDSRTPDYVKRFGEEVVEVEALPPEELQKRLRDALKRHRDLRKWDKARVIEASDRERLHALLDAEDAE
jgi:hypothetical protein